MKRQTFFPNFTLGIGVVVIVVEVSLKGVSPVPDSTPGIGTVTARIHEPGYSNQIRAKGGPSDSHLRNHREIR